MADRILSPADVEVVTKNGYAQQGYAYVDMPNQGGLGYKPGSWNWCAHIWSTFTMLCCCWCLCCSSIFGVVGLIFSNLSYTDYKSGDYEASRYKKVCAIGWTLAGIVLGLGTLATVAYFGYTQGPAVFAMAKTFLTEQLNGIMSGLVSQNIPSG
ncbi:hypothetical protein LSH36_55g09070 [Paralvinella palmiformis]|uniref:Interferon-induced transmembrane protein n=1 Tax=Paralvinella palmiformis TaxID=53620 RepID=A0AAD9NEA9_9ANNE|nr:hypothetical protein LSH36_55g09070 [Paralvinella palmiformis]